MTKQKLILALAALLFCSALSAGTVTLTWKDNSDNETGFAIERSINGGEFSVIANVVTDITRYVDDSPQVGAMNTYRVCAFNSFGKSGYTNESGVGVYVPDDPSDLETKLELDLGSPSAKAEKRKKHKKWRWLWRGRRAA